MAGCLGAFECAHVYREVEVSPVEDAVAGGVEQVVDEVSVDGVVIFRVSVNHHVHETAFARVLQLAMEVDVLTCSPHASRLDGPHGVGVERVAVHANGIAEDARESCGINVPVGAVGRAVLDGVVEQDAVVELHLVGCRHGGVEVDRWLVVVLVESESGVVVLVDASVGDDVGQFGLKCRVEISVMTAVASRECQ